MRIGKFLLIVCALAIPFTLSGCTSGKPTGGTPAESEAHDEHGHDHDDHESGPHGGHLIELGDEEYHLEWSHDDETKALTFYVLGSDAKADVPIKADSITVNVTVEGASKPFEVPAVRKEGEMTTAKFETKDPDLFALLEDENVKAAAILEIEGKPYEGAIEHHHDHGHAH
ncbi:hypothetical protein GC197_07495 [bacterium]|nr:hypothetical protein [bacterium]